MVLSSERSETRGEFSIRGGINQRDSSDWKNISWRWNCMTKHDARSDQGWSLTGFVVHGNFPTQSTGWSPLLRQLHSSMFAGSAPARTGSGTRPTNVPVALIRFLHSAFTLQRMSLRVYSESLGFSWSSNSIAQMFRSSSNLATESVRK